MLSIPMSLPLSILMTYHADIDHLIIICCSSTTLYSFSNGIYHENGSNLVRMDSYSDYYCTVFGTDDSKDATNKC